MTWSFETDPEFEEKLEWVRAFVKENVEPLDYSWGKGLWEIHAPKDEERRRIVGHLKDQVKEQGLWACHLGPELGGQGFGQVKLALINEIVGRTAWGPIIFGIQAPDTGNAEILAHYGTAEQKATYLDPLLNGDIISCFAMTEPQGGADPDVFTTTAERDGDEWVLRGEKIWATNARNAAFFIVMAITDPTVKVVNGASMFLVPAGTPGLNVLQDLGTFAEPYGEGAHAHLEFDGVRIPETNLLGEPGKGFLIAQTRLSGGRLHHAMRTIGRIGLALDMVCERALSRHTKGEVLADKQLVQAAIADAYMETQQFRLFVLYTAWLMDTQGAPAARREIAATKVIAARVFLSVVSKSIQIHGAMGASNMLPLHYLWNHAPTMGVMDGPTEVHQVTIARQLLREYSPAPGRWPTEYLPDRIAAANKRIAELSEFAARKGTSPVS